MEDIKSKKIMVLDTEYETYPNRLLAMSYLIYQYNEELSEFEKISKTCKFIKHPEEIFTVDENGASFSFHKLTNEFLDENGISINDALDKFYKKLLEVDILVGQNIVNADIKIIRKEAIGINIWYEFLEEEIKSKSIFDTMNTFKNKNTDEKYSLDSIYYFLFGKEMKNHHDPVYDCKNTFKCFTKMLKNDYEFKKEELKFSEDYFFEIMKELPKCNICDSKIPEDNNRYKFKIDEFIENTIGETYKYKYTLLKRPEKIYKKDNILCSKCVSNLEIIISKDDLMIDIVKMKTSGHISNQFFEKIGSEKTVYLISKYKDKDEIRKLGGKWDALKKSWYFNYTPKTIGRLEKFKKWIPEQEENNVA